MLDLDFKWTLRRDEDGTEIFSIEGPDPRRDKLIELHSEAADNLAARFGRKPSRNTLHRWRRDGYAIDRNWPRVVIPHTVYLKRVYTSAPALARWFKTIEALRSDIVSCGGVKKWRSIQKETKR